MLLSLCMMLFASPPLAEDEAVIFFPSLARMTAQNTWEIVIHGWVFEPEYDSESRKALKETLQKSFGDLSPSEAQMFDKRMSWFLVDNERRKKITIRLGNQKIALPKSDASGHFRKEVTFSGSEAQVPKRFQVVLAAGDRRIFSGRIHVVPPGGWAVVSDLDDTLKISGVLDKKTLLRNTFCRPFKATPGFQKFYADWANQGASFHYLSASPWQLYPDLNDFMRAHAFPEGVFYLRPLRVKDHTFSEFLFADKQAYKRDHVLALYQAFPKKHFLLVGDSGEKDPEVYADIANRFPERTLGILIRQVHPNPNPQRMEAVKARIGKVRLVEFRDTSELAEFKPLMP